MQYLRPHHSLTSPGMRERHRRASKPVVPATRATHHKIPCFRPASATKRSRRQQTFCGPDGSPQDPRLGNLRRSSQHTWVETSRLSR